MPYWSSSKVGAVPQTQGKAKGKQGLYRKGITLSDLKRQTAIRLAKEQQLKGESLVSEESRLDTKRTSEPRRHHPVSPNPYGHSGAHAMQQFPDERHYQSRSNFRPCSSRGTFGAPPMAQQPVAIVSTSHQYYHDQENNHRAAPLHSHSSSSMSESNGKGKLPHGLTVHELKEMTKARLQAEASEQTRDISTPEPYVTLHAREQEHRERSVHAFAPTSQQSYGRSVRSPPVAETSYHQPQESWSHDSRNDVWESGSVSTSASEYLGSEKGYPLYDETGYGNRGRSFSASNVSTQDMIRDAPSPSIMQQPPFYEGFIVPNRRRAATLSPRAGLTHLDEDRPLVGAPSIPVTNALSTPSKLNPRSAVSPFDQGLVLDGIGPNRARTSSAASLPPMSHTAEEFGCDPHISRFGSLPEEDAAVTGLSDAFRSFESASGIVYVPENRTRASTWSNTSDVNDVFGPGLIGANNGNGMENDLAFLLKLSGAEEEPEAHSDKWL